MLLAVFDARVALQVHAADSVAQSFRKAKGAGLDPTEFYECASGLARSYTAEDAENRCF
jgi:hypothetical protein